MTAPERFLALAARQGRLVLILGLVAGIVWPALARAMQPMIVPFIMLMLAVAAARIGPGQARLTVAALARAAGLTVAFQTFLPLAGMAVLWASGVLAQPWALGVVLALAASPITGSPGLAILSRSDPVPALRQLILGTALLPLTVLPVFWFMPVFADPLDTLLAAGRLLLIIGVAGGAGFWLHGRVPQLGTARGQGALDGLMALTMGIVVIALMSAVGPALWAGDRTVWALLALVLVLNFGIQAGVAGLTRAAGSAGLAPAMGIVAGNRNLALFLGALPADTVAALMLFVGVYQIPMYLTPLVMTGFYRRMVAAAPG